MRIAILSAALLAVLVLPTPLVQDASAIELCPDDGSLDCDAECRLEHEYGYCHVRVMNTHVYQCFYTPDGCEDPFGSTA